MKNRQLCLHISHRIVLSNTHAHTHVNAVTQTCTCNETHVRTQYNTRTRLMQLTHTRNAMHVHTQGTTALNILPQSKLAAVYRALIESHLRCGSIILGCISNKKLDNLQKLQSRAKKIDRKRKTQGWMSL